MESAMQEYLFLSLHPRVLKLKIIVELVNLVGQQTPIERHRIRRVCYCEIIKYFTRPV